VAANVGTDARIKYFMQTLKRPICALPIALFGLAAVGTFWSDAPWVKRRYAINPTAKLLVRPALFYHFERSSRGIERFYKRDQTSFDDRISQPC
jgi:O-antigen ligase